MTTKSDMVIAGQQDNSSLIVNDQIDEKKLLAKLGEKEENFEFTPDQPQHFWQPEADTYLVGVVEGKYSFTHPKYGEGECFIIRLTQSGFGTNRDDNQVEQLEVNDKIAVLKRHAFREFEKLIGREVVIICDGCIKTRNDNDFWKVRVGVRKQETK